MILPQYIEHLESLRPYFKGPMLLLGDQEFKSPFDFGCNYKTLDISWNADIKHDLTKPANYLGQFESVFNLGTLEHIWDVHSAYSNVIKLIKLNGFYIGHSPVAGWEGHGMHISNWKQIVSFFEGSGFIKRELFFSDHYQPSGRCEAPTRNGGRSIIMWSAFEKIKETEIVSPIDLC